VSYLLLGLTLGLSAGITPGPLLTLVITASLRRGLRGGLLVALAPFITDAPIIALSLLLLDRLPPWAMTVVTLVGGLVVIYLGIDALRAARSAEVPGPTAAGGGQGRDLWKGALVNLLNPHPYIFWATVGGPALLAGWREGARYGSEKPGWHECGVRGSGCGVRRSGFDAGLQPEARPATSFPCLLVPLSTRFFLRGAP